MKITAWLGNALNTLRSLLFQLMALPRTLWHTVRTRGTAPFRRNEQTAPPATDGAGPQGFWARLQPISRRISGLWRRSAPTTGTAVTSENRPNPGNVGKMRLAKVGAGVRYILQPVRKGFIELWQWIKPLFTRFSSPPQSQDGLTLRKIGVKRSYRYNLDPSPLRQLLADVANTLAIGVGLGAWPYQRAWFAESLPPVLAAHSWVLSALISGLPLLVFYLRWQYVRQQGATASWDRLTLATGLIGLFLALFAGTLMFGTFTGLNGSVTAMIWAGLAVAAWLVSEGANLYAILIRRPYPLPAVLSLSKSLLFMLSGWLILLYLVLVNLYAGTIQLESAAFLFAIFQTLVFLGVLLALADYGIRRFNLKLPRFATIAN